MPELEYIDEATDIPSVQFTQQSSDIAAPGAGFWQLFFKSTGTWIRQNAASAIRLLTTADLTNLTFPASARIKGEFQNATTTTATAFQTALTNGNTSIPVLPDGTGNVSNHLYHSSSDPANSAYGVFGANASAGVGINTAKSGTGTTLPMTFRVDGVEKGRLAPDGKWGFGTNSPTALVDINSDILRLRTAKTPANSSATGNQGDICWDASYLYICTANNTWKRIALSSF